MYLKNMYHKNDFIILPIKEYIKGRAPPAAIPVNDLRNKYSQYLVTNNVQRQGPSPKRIINTKR